MVLLQSVKKHGQAVEPQDTKEQSLMLAQIKVLLLLCGRILIKEDPVLYTHTTMLLNIVMLFNTKMFNTMEWDLLPRKPVEVTI
jgi:hypothetical protein